MRRNFIVTPIDKNTFIFCGDAATGKTFFAKRIGALYFNISKVDNEVMKPISLKIAQVNHETGKYPVVVYITNSRQIATQLTQYLEELEVSNETI